MKCPARKRPPLAGGPLHSPPCRSRSTDTSSDRCRRTATSCAASEAPPNARSSTRAATPPASASSSRGSARPARGSSSLTATSTISAASPTSRRERAPRCGCRKESASGSSATRSSLRWASPDDRTRPSTCWAAGRRSRSRASRSSASPCRVTRRPTSPSTPRASSSAATCSSRARSGASTCPEPTGTRSSRRCACSRSGSRPRRWSTRDTARRRRSASSSRATRSWQSSARRSHEPLPGAARDARRPAAGPPVVARDPHDRGAVRAVRLVPRPHARVRGDGALRAHGGRGVRRRAQGDVHVRGPRRPLAHLAPRGDGPDRARVRRARAGAGAATGQGVHDRADVPLLAPGPRPLPRALAAVARGDRLGGSRRRRRGDPVLRGAPATARRDGLGAAPQLDRGRELPPAVRGASGGLARRASRARRRGGRPQARDERPAGVRRQGREAPRGARRCAEDRRIPLRRMPRALRRGPGAPRRLRRPVRPRRDARARPRLLHAHDLRVPRAGGERQLRALRRRPLRRARRGGRRAAHAGHRRRRRPRAARARDGAGGSDGRGAAARRLRRVRGARAARTAPAPDREVAGGGARRRHRLRWPVDEGAADTGATARRGDRRRRTQRRDVRGAAARAGGPRRELARGALMAWRNAMCGELRAEDAGRLVTLAGWADARRDHGGLVFVDLRDHTGKVQLVVNPGHSAAAAETAHGIRNEFVLQATGEVVARAPELANPNLPTGRVEVQVDELRILSRSTPLPFQLDEENVDETLRLRYRWLDLRRERLQRNIRLRGQMVGIMRRVMEEAGFVDIQTPSMTRGTPEGARDFLTPVRLQPGTFFALAQSPQLYKQLCMIGGLDRYYQIATCWRDEDLRADRQFEFRQLDLEMAFAESDDVLDVLEAAVVGAFEALEREPPAVPFPRLTFADAMARYGSDKPDLRYGLEIVDATELTRGSRFGVFAHAPCVRFLVAPRAFSRAELARLEEIAKEWGAKGLAYVVVDETGELRSPIAKFLSDAELAAVRGERGTTALFAAGEEVDVSRVLGGLRAHLGRELGLAQDADSFHWVLDFPLFERDEDSAQWTFLHHP